MGRHLCRAARGGKCSLYMAILGRYILAMSTINISTLKNQLSAVLQRVRRGEEVVVMDRDRPIARLGPVRHAVGAGDHATVLAELEQRGILTIATRPRPTRQWIERQCVRGVRGSAVQALLKEREEGR